MKVFLDLDGVLVDFLSGLHKALKAPYSYDDYRYTKGKWDMFEEIPATFDKCNDCCCTVFWMSLKLMHDANKILDLVRCNFPDESIYLLTTPMLNMGSWRGKAEWVEKHLPKFSKRLIITTTTKSLLAGPDSLLIDDRDQNVEEFRAAGGKTILVPRPWNKLHASAWETVDVVKRELERLT